MRYEMCGRWENLLEVLSASGTVDASVVIIQTLSVSL